MLNAIMVVLLGRFAGLYPTCPSCGHSRQPPSQNPSPDAYRKGAGRIHGRYKSLHHISVQKSPLVSALGSAAISSTSANHGETPLPAFRANSPRVLYR